MIILLCMCGHVVIDISVVFFCRFFFVVGVKDTCALVTIFLNLKRVRVLHVQRNNKKQCDMKDKSYIIDIFINSTSFCESTSASNENYISLFSKHNSYKRESHPIGI